MSTLTDKNINVQELIDSPLKRDRFYRKMYKDDSLRTMVRKKINDLGARSGDFEDVFQDSMVIFDQKLRQGKFSGGSSLRTFFIGIAINVFKNKRKSAYQSKKTDNEHVWDSLIDANIPADKAMQYDDLKRLLQKTLDQIGEPCKSILVFWQFGYSMQWITEQLNLDGGTEVRKIKFRCMKKIQTLMDKEFVLKKNLYELWKTLF